MPQSDDRLFTMNTHKPDNSQQDVDNEVADLSVSDPDDMALRAELAITLHTPQEVKEAALSTEDLAALETALADLEPHDPKAELRALMRKVVEDLKAENYRNGRKAQAHKKQLRDDYADMIMQTEGREVRPYLPATTKRRQDQNSAAQKKRRDNMTPEQKRAESNARAARRNRKKAEEKAAAKKADARTIA
ncbi:hypothetical protein [Rhizobium laguerreae]|uniref:hypothetical protein n=1 Tax=Rhizobium laguerreae TaxID=1076926 RepID=UPI001C8FF1A2|nr:hypothetical protein [Rhizobium laguerreae]MBY3493882.1 hypothetical protein [Rhizobium laguerreae]